MKQISMAATALLAIFVLAGCGLQSGKSVMKYDSISADVPPPNTVHDPGTYALYPSDGTNPIVSKQLKEGDQYGFTKNDQGKVVGFVIENGQQQQIPLTAKLATSYLWKYQK